MLSPAEQALDRKEQAQAENAMRQRRIDKRRDYIIGRESRFEQLVLEEERIVALRAPRSVRTYTHRNRRMQRAVVHPEAVLGFFSKRFVGALKRAFRTCRHTTAWLGCVAQASAVYPGLLRVFGDFRTVVKTFELPQFKMDGSPKWVIRPEYGEHLQRHGKPMNPRADVALFTVDYDEDGEAGLGVANKVHGMTGFERIIFEDGHNGSGNAQRQSLNVPTIGSARKVESLAKRLCCTLDQAEDFIDFFRIVDEESAITEQLVKMVLDSIAKYGHTLGIAKALEYFEAFAGELVDVVDESPMSTFDASADFQPELSDENELVETLSDDWKESLGLLWGRQVASAAPAPSDEIDPELFDRFLDRHGWTIPAGEAYVKTYHADMPSRIDDTSTWGYEFFRHSDIVYLDKPFGTPDVFRYVNINDDVPHPYFPVGVSMDSGLFNQVLGFVENAGLDEINRWRQLVGAGDARFADMNGAQASLFWAVASWRKARQERIKDEYLATMVLSPAEQRLLDRFSKASSLKQVGFFWACFYEARAGRQDLGSQIFREHVLAPALARRKEQLLAMDQAVADRGPIIADDAFGALMASLA